MVACPCLVAAVSVMAWLIPSHRFRRWMSCLHLQTQVCHPGYAARRLPIETQAHPRGHGARMLPQEMQVPYVTLSAKTPPSSGNAVRPQVELAPQAEVDLARSAVRTRGPAHPEPARGRAVCRGVRYHLARSAGRARGPARPEPECR